MYFLTSLALLVLPTITLLTSKNLEQIKKNCSVHIEKYATLLIKILFDLARAEDIFFMSSTNISSNDCVI